MDRGDLALDGEQVGLHHVRVGRRRLPGDHRDAGTAHPEEVRAERAAGDGVLHGGVTQVAGGWAGVPAQEGRHPPGEHDGGEVLVGDAAVVGPEDPAVLVGVQLVGDAVGVGHDVLRDRDEVVHPHPDPGEHDPRVVGRLACAAESGLQGEDQAGRGRPPRCPRRPAPPRRTSRTPRREVAGDRQRAGLRPLDRRRLGIFAAAEPQREPGPLRVLVPERVAVGGITRADVGQAFVVDLHVKKDPGGLCPDTADVRKVWVLSPSASTAVGGTGGRAGSSGRWTTRRPSST